MSALRGPCGMNVPSLKRMRAIRRPPDSRLGCSCFRAAQREKVLPLMPGDDHLEMACRHRQKLPARVAVTTPHPFNKR